MKKLLIALAVFLVVLLGAALVAPGFVDWNQYKAEITAEAEKATGRRLTVAGDVGLAVLPAPVLKASKVSLANVEGGSEPEMLTLETLEIRVSLLPLLGGHLQVTSVSLVEPRILLEELADGRNNWGFEPPAQPDAATATDSAVQPPESGAPVPAPESEPEAAAEGDPGDFAVQIDSFTIEDGLLVYRDASGVEERIEAIDAEIVAESLSGPFTLEGEAELRGLRTTVDAAVGRLLDAGATTLNIGLGAPDAEASAQFIGSLSRHPTATELRGKLKGEGASLAALLRAALPDAERLPAALGNPFELEAAIEADQSEATLAELRVGLGDTSIEGSGSLALGPPATARLKLTSSRLDLDALLAEARPDDGADAEEAEPAPAAAEQAADDGESVEEAGAAPEAAAAGGGFHLPADIEATLQLGVDAVVYREQVVRQVRLNAALSEGRVEVNQAMALLPGGSDLSVTGALLGGAEGPRFDGHLEAASDNLRGVLEWLGADLAAIPADRLRKMSLSTRVQAAPNQVSLADLDLRVDVSRIGGGVVAALRERPGLGIGLALDSLNLDAYLPRAAAAPEDGGGADAAETGSEEAEAEQQAAEEPAEAPARPRGPLEAFDANLNLRIGSLVYGGQTARDIAIEGTLQDGALTFKQARVADLAGSALSYSGAVSGLGAKPTLDGSVDLRIADPVKLARIAGIESAALQRIGPFNLTGNLKGSLDGLGFNSKLAALDGRFGLAGTAQPLASPPSFDVVLEAAHPDLARLTEAIAGTAAVGPGLGGLDAKARLAGTLERLRISELSGVVGPFGLTGGLDLALAAGRPTPLALDLAVHVKHGSLARLSSALGGPSLGEELGGIDLKGRAVGDGQSVTLSGLSGVAGPLGISGEIAASLADGAPALGDFNLNLRLKHGSLAALAAAAGVGAAVSPAFGGVDLGAHVFGSASRVDLRDLNGSLGPVALAGTASVDVSGAKPFVAADLTTGALSLSQLLASAQAPQGSGGSGGAGGTGAGSLSPRWSAAPLDLSALQAVNADLKLRSSLLSYDKIALEEADLAALLNDGRLELQRLTGRLHGGAVQASGRLDAKDLPSASIVLSASEIDSGTLLVELADFERVRGPVTVNASLTTQGRSEAELISGLSGQGDVAGTLTISAKAEEAAGAALLNLLGQKVKEVRGLAATTGSLFQAFAGAPSRLSGSFLVDRGVVRSTDLRLEGRDAVALTSGSASLPAWLVDSRTEVFRAGQSGQPFLTATLSGALDKPNTKIGGELLQRREQPAAQPGGGQPEGGQTGGTQPAEPQELEPEDLIKGLIDRLN